MAAFESLATYQSNEKTYSIILTNLRMKLATSQTNSKLIREVLQEVLEEIGMSELSVQEKALQRDIAKQIDIHAFVSLFIYAHFMLCYVTYGTI